MLKSVLCLALAGLSMAACAAEDGPFDRDSLPANGVWLETLELGNAEQEWNVFRPVKSNGGSAITLNGVVYAHGVGTAAPSRIRVDLDGSCTRFETVVGIDDEVPASDGGSIVFQVWVDNIKAADSGVMRPGDVARFISVDLSGASHMALVVTDAGDGTKGDHADWAGARFVTGADASNRPSIPAIDTTPMPIASARPSELRINGPRVIGTTPGRDFIFRIPATGDIPIRYSASKLPEGLTVDPETGIITGRVARAGTYKAKIRITNATGSCERDLTIIAGDHKLAQTPPMGWNSYNVWGCDVDDARVRAAADWMVKSGLAAHGYQQVNIDEGWAGERDANGRIHSCERFPDMKALADYVHSKGLKLGIYSSPGPKSCGGRTGSYGHGLSDARTYAEWGVDYLKYDECSYIDFLKADTPEEHKKPYQLMRDALDQCDRDIVYSLCQYGKADVWKWGADVGANLWRATYDLIDNWMLLTRFVYSNDIAASPYAKPGHWNDADMMVVGKVGWGTPRPTKLTPNEQISHMTIWSMLASPLILGCDLSQLDQFTIDLITNDEVIDVDQDPLGKSARRVSAMGDACEVWSRPLCDGTIAVALLNRDVKEADITVKWSDLGLSGRRPVRDLWLREDVGEFSDSYTAPVKAHGAVLVKVGRPRR